MLLIHMSNFVSIEYYLLYVPLTLYFANAIAKFYSHIKNIVIRYFLDQTFTLQKHQQNIL